MWKSIVSQNASLAAMDEDDDDLFAEFDVDVDMDKDASESPKQAAPIAHKANDETAADMHDDMRATADNVQTADQSIHNKSSTATVEANDNDTNMAPSPTGKAVLINACFGSTSGRLLRKVLTC